MNEDLLVVSNGRLVKMYSLSWIIKNCTILSASLGQFIEMNREIGEELRAGAVGNPDFGIPCTIKLTGKSRISRHIVTLWRLSLIQEVIL